MVSTKNRGETDLDVSHNDNRLKVHFKSSSKIWPTPQPFFNTLNAEFGFTLDVCAIPQNAKCINLFLPEEDGLKQRWQGICWMNPPYGRTIGQWIKKAYESAQEGATVVCLVPARTDTSWWHTWVVRSDEVRFIRGRLKFGDSKNSAPFPSAVVVFRSSLGHLREQGIEVTLT